MTKKDNQNELVDKLYKLNLIQASENTKQLNKILEHQYKFYVSRVIDLQEELDNTPKIFKKKRANLEQEIQQTQDKANKNFKDYLAGCEDFYNLHQELYREQ